MGVFTQRQVGIDGALHRVSIGDDVTGTIPADGWYRIKAKATVGSELPAALEIGDLYYMEEDALLETGDVVEPLVTTKLCDIEEANYEVTQNEIDVTTICDQFSRYRGGRMDLSGSISGVFTLGVTDAAGGIQNKFFRQIEQAANGSVTVSEADGAPIWLLVKLQEQKHGIPVEAFVWMQVVLLGFGAGVGGNDKQSFSSNFRISGESGEPTYYKRIISAGE